MASEHPKRERESSDTNDVTTSDNVLIEKELGIKRKKTLHGWLNIVPTGRVSVAIIGTAGRYGLWQKMTRDLFYSMLDVARTTITDVWKLDLANVNLVSGGAAWSDHVAVALYLKEYSHGTKLTLFLPCPLTSDQDGQDTKIQFFDSGSNDWRVNPGRSANTHHAHFSLAMGYNVIADIAEAQKMGALLDTSQQGFHSRDLEIAKASHLLAFSWSEGRAPETGGTKHTWSACKGIKHHVPLPSLLPSNIDSKSSIL